MKGWEWTKVQFVGVIEVRRRVYVLLLSRATEEKDEVLPVAICELLDMI